MRMSLETLAIHAHVAPNELFSIRNSPYKKLSNNDHAKDHLKYEIFEAKL